MNSIIRSFAFALLGCVASLSALAASRQWPAELPGVRMDGSVLLPNQWSLRPAGAQVQLGDFPVNIAVHPKGRHAAILHCGYSKQELAIVSLMTNGISARQTLDEAFYGVEFSRDGSKVFCSGAGQEVIHQFDFRDGLLTNHVKISLRPSKDRGVPSGLALSSDGRFIYAANVWGHSVAQVDVAARSNVWELALGSTNLVVGVTNRVVPPDDKDLAAATKRAEALLDEVGSLEPFPYACRLDEKRQRLYVSLWAQATVAVIDLKSRAVIARWQTEEHPNEMLLTKSGRLLYVANANRNTVTVLDADLGKPVETLFASMLPTPLPGSTPNSLALSPDERMLFVANACNNNVAVFDVSARGRSRSLGFIPVGWYPTSVRVTPDGKQLLVANGKGPRSKPNLLGPQPGPKPAGTIEEHIGELFHGTLSVIDLPKRSKFEKQLVDHSKQAYVCSPYQTNQNPALIRSANNPIPAQVGESSPIKYVIYVIKENRTYDQVLGDMPEGNGDARLCLFPEKVTPNHHAISREFVLLDNFYVEAEVSADGHEWTMGAYATDFVEKMWPMNYGHNKSGKFPYPSEGRYAIAAPAGGYLWDRARDAGVTYRSYGEFIDPPKQTNQPAVSRVAALRGHFDEWFRPWDMDYPDVKRAERFIQELNRFEREGEMPRLQIVRLPNDHTFGASLGKPTPTAMVGDNDQAFGMFVEAVSRSKFWAQTAIFVIEDDAQNGPDHVDAHRSIAFVVSPYTKRRAVDSTMYSTSSMLRTMELILGLRPMTQFDATAMPMYNSFQATPDLTPYKAKPVTVNMSEKNKRTAWGVDQSSRMDFSKEDAADDLLLNETVWRSVKGADNPMPAPTRASFVRIRAGKDDDD
ncbi:MAG: YncE family protein [Pedosphaera sp.]|nr:YncE family protein [Pedosphaera sp.]